MLAVGAIGVLLSHTLDGTVALKVRQRGAGSLAPGAELSRPCDWIPANPWRE